MSRRYWDPTIETMDRDELLRLQFKKLRDLLQTTAKTNQFYRDRWNSAGVKLDKIRTLEDFAAVIPTVEKADFVADQDDCPPLGKRHQHAVDLHCPMIFTNTSGTSGQGVEIHAQTAAEFRTTEQIYGFHMRWAGLGDGDRVFLTLPITMMTGGRVEYHGAVGNGLSVFPVGNYDARRKIELMQRYRPRALFGTTSYFGHLSAVCPDPASFGIDTLLTGGEGSGFAWLERLESAWGAKVFDRYGSTQSGNDHMFCCEHGIGSSARPGMLHNIDHLVLFEVVDSQTGRQVKDGEAGEIVLTSLYHNQTPLIRCRMRDRAVYRSNSYCACGRPFAGVEVATIARLDDMKKVKGVNIWPQAVDAVMFAEPHVDEYQVHLQSGATGADTAIIRVMPKTVLAVAETEAWTAAMVDMLRARIGISFDVELVPPGAIERSEYKAKRWLDERLHAQR
jgi:phenylacetate-CoA ligase